MSPEPNPLPNPDPGPPFRSPSLSLSSRRALAFGQSRRDRLWAAMAQTDCQACGYDCQGLAEAINRGEIRDLALCAPGGAETTRALREICASEPGSAAESPSEKSDDKLILLGTGTSYGIPMIGCACAVCRSPDARDQRGRSSAILESRGKRLLIDAGPDLRQQFLRENIAGVDAVFITHAHADHMMGLDDLRPISLQRDSALPIYADSATAEALRATFPYIFAKRERRLGLPWMELVEIEPEVPFEIAGLQAVAFEVVHGKGRNLGLRFGDFAYLTDCKVIPDPARKVLMGVKMLVLDMLREEEHPTHLCLEESRALVRDLEHPRTWFVHMGHEVLHAGLEPRLPNYETLGYDGLTMPLGDLLRP